MHHPRKAGQHPGGVHGHLAPLEMDGGQAQGLGGGRVDPVQPARHPGTGLIKVRHRRASQPRANDLHEPGQPGRPRPPHRPASRWPSPRRARRQQLRGPVDGQVLVHAQVAHQRAHPRPVAGRRAGARREGRGGRAPTGAAAPLGPVLHHPQANRRQVEHLPRLDPDHRRAGQVRAAPAAPIGQVPDDLVGLGVRPAGACAAHPRTAAWRSWRSPCRAGVPAQRRGLGARHWPPPVWRWPPAARR